jgi:hypothetical protein
MKEIIMTVKDDGEISIETKGFKGKTCLKESQFLKDVLGSEISRELIPAYYEFNPETQASTKKYLNLCG